MNANGGLFEVWDEESEGYRLVTITQIKDSKQTNLDLPTPSHDDVSLVFMGWSKTPDGNEGRWYSDFDEDTTLYAVWKESIIITLDFNGGFCGDEVYDDILEEYQYDAEIIKKKIAPGGGINLWDDAFNPSINDQGKSFAGWSLTKDGEPLTENDGYYYPEESCTLYAIWKAPISVKLDAMGGFFTESFNAGWDDEWTNAETLKSRYTITENGMTIETATGRAILLPEPEYKDDDRAFEGWSLIQNGIPVQLNDFGGISMR